MKADAQKAKIEVEYISAADVAKGFDEMFNQPPAVIEAMKKYLQPG